MKPRLSVAIGPSKIELIGSEKLFQNAFANSLVNNNAPRATKIKFQNDNLLAGPVCVGTCDCRPEVCAPHRGGMRYEEPKSVNSFVDGTSQRFMSAIDDKKIAEMYNLSLSAAYNGAPLPASYDALRETYRSQLRSFLAKEIELIDDKNIFKASYNGFLKSEISQMRDRAVLPLNRIVQEYIKNNGWKYQEAAPPGNADIFARSDFNPLVNRVLGKTYDEDCKADNSFSGWIYWLTGGESRCMNDMLLDLDREAYAVKSKERAKLWKRINAVMAEDAKNVENDLLQDAETVVSEFADTLKNAPA